MARCSGSFRNTGRGTGSLYSATGSFLRPGIPAEAERTPPALYPTFSATPSRGFLEPASGIPSTGGVDPAPTIVLSPAPPEHLFPQQATPAADALGCQVAVLADSVGIEQPPARKISAARTAQVARALLRGHLCVPRVARWGVRGASPISKARGDPADLFRGTSRRELEPALAACSPGVGVRCGSADSRFWHAGSLVPCKLNTSAPPETPPTGCRW
jgi:hypothetical protein